MEALGFPVCVADLEDELIRALGLRASSTSSPPKATCPDSGLPEPARPARAGR